VGEGEGVCDGAGRAVLQETEAGIAMGGVEHYYCTPQRPHSQKHNLAFGTSRPLEGGKEAATSWVGDSVQRNRGCAAVSKDAIPASCSDQSRSYRTGLLAFAGGDTTAGQQKGLTTTLHTVHHLGVCMSVVPRP
jgi:hypothetical protein